ncbi:MAG: tetratricopeptide repeat protein [Pirellulaceae bacterium]|nr:tetratricopeptide repeat protein [Pirellulaceae bacterium]
MTIRLAMTATAVSCILLSGGCQQQTDLSRLTSQRKSSSQEDDLTQAVSMIRRLDSEPFSQIQSLLIFHLNRWAEQQPRDPQWNLEPLINRLPFTTENHPHMEQLLFHLSDAFYLQETSWLHSIANWVESRTNRKHLDRFSRIQTEGLSDEERSELQTACRLFDWSVRHLQLRPLVPYPTTGSGDTTKERSVAPSLGIEGPGYTRIPHDILSHGSGDAWQRGRIFIQLARQRQIKVVYLGLRKDKQRRTQPWLTAAIIGKRLFLFDNELGIPLPMNGGQKIATLSDLKENPALLDNLAVDDEPYRVVPDDLENVVALVDACHCAISQRMMILEKHLTGENQMVLTETPGRISRQMRNDFGIDRTELLPASMETFFYKVGFQRKIQETLGKIQQMELNAANATTSAQASLLQGQIRMARQPIARQNRENALLFSELSELVAGRRMFFRGEFGDSTLTRAGQGTRNAKTLLLGSRLPDDLITALKSSPEMQEQHGLLPKPNEPPENHQSRVETTMYVMGESKKYATFWISMIHMEEGNYSAAINWLEKRTLSTGELGPFYHLARYNLARCYEATGQHEKACEILEQSTSPQARGDRLLAAMLSKGS